MAPALAKAHKDLSADSLFSLLRSGFDSLPDPRPRSDEIRISLSDALMSAFAMFSLKDPSLLAFDHRRRDPLDNFRSLYGILNVPCDSQMRDILDPLNPNDLRPGFTEVFRRLQRGKILERFAYLDGHYLLSLDGTTYFSSAKIPCPSCLEKHHRGGGITYSHQLLGATLVHPDLKEVIPLAPEPIIQQDGQTKNDCQRNATRRWLKQFRREHPHLPVIVVEDALAANAPHLKDRREARAHFIIGVKPGDHAFLFEHLQARDETGQMPIVTWLDPATGILHHFRFCREKKRERGRREAGGGGRVGKLHLAYDPVSRVRVLLCGVKMLGLPRQCRAAQRVAPRRVGERAGILGDPSRPDGAAFQWDHRFPAGSGERLGHHARGTSPLEDRE